MLQRGEHTAGALRGLRQLTSDLGSFGIQAGFLTVFGGVTGSLINTQLQLGGAALPARQPF